MEGMPEALVDFPTTKIIVTFNKIRQDDLGEVMKRYLETLIDRLNANSSEFCNSMGLYFVMLNMITIFSSRAERDAVQHAIPSFVARIEHYSENEIDRKQAKIFIEQFNKIAAIFGSQLKTFSSKKNHMN